MKKVMTVVSAFAAFVSVFAAQVNRVLVRQQWPWNADVRIEYDVSGLSNPAEVTFKFFDNEKEISVMESTIFNNEQKTLLDKVEELTTHSELNIVFKKSLTDREQLVFEYFLNNIGKTVFAFLFIDNSG